MHLGKNGCLVPTYHLKRKTWVTAANSSSWPSPSCGMSQKAGQRQQRLSMQ